MCSVTQKASKEVRIIFKVYPPDEEYDYPHYKSGFKAWSAYSLLDKLSLVVSIIVLIAVYTKK